MYITPKGKNIFFTNGGNMKFSFSVPRKETSCLFWGDLIYFAPKFQKQKLGKIKTKSTHAMSDVWTTETGKALALKLSEWSGIAEKYLVMTEELVEMMHKSFPTKIAFKNNVKQIKQFIVDGLMEESKQTMIGWNHRDKIVFS